MKYTHTSKAIPSILPRLSCRGFFDGHEYSFTACAKCNASFLGIIEGFVWSGFTAATMGYGFSGVCFPLHTQSYPKSWRLPTLRSGRQGTR